jgi:ATP-dependent RNA helicase RhlE
MTSFSDLGLNAALLRAVATEGYTTPSPIQLQAIPHVLAGRDVQGVAQTGTGKTAAFALPILHRLAAAHARPAPKTCRALVVAPTRELASQIAESFRAYGRHTGLSVALVFGGVPKPSQIRQLSNGVDILVATPGRLLDHINARALRLNAVEVLVLDEADHMLDLGFIVPIRQIAALTPANRQTLLFTATMPPAIAKLAAGLLHDPVQVAVVQVATTVEQVSQHVMFVDTAAKRGALRSLLAKSKGRTLVFTRTKHGADRVTEDLAAHGIASEAIHGNKAQNHRERTLRGFRAGTLRVLVATDIAARGLDIPGVSHVFNFDLPDEPESYVHRIGRTARAGRDGIAIAFCAGDELEQLRDIERLTGQEIPLDASQPMHINLHRMPDRGQRSSIAGRSQQARTQGTRRPQGGHQHQPRHQGPRPEAASGLRNDLGERRQDGPRGGEARPDGGARRDRPRNDGPREPRTDGFRGSSSGQGSSGGAPKRRRRNPSAGSGGGQGIGNRGPEGGVSGFFGAIKRKLGGH